MPCGEIVPTLEFPPFIPLTLHVYFNEFPPVLVVPAVWTTANCTLWEVGTMAEEGDTVSAVGATMLTVACPDFDGSAALVATTVTLDVEGTVDGAV